MAILTLNAIPTNTEIKLIAPGYSQIGNTIQVNNGTNVEVILTCVGYNTINEHIVVTTDMVKDYELEKRIYNVEFETYPEDVLASTTLNGKEKLGKTRQCLYGELVSYSFEKKGYESRKGTIKVIDDVKQKIVLLVERKYENVNDESIKEHRNISNIYPAQFSDKKLISNYLKSVVDPFFEKPDEKIIEGYIGKRNEDTEKSAHFIEEISAERQNNQLVPVAITNSSIGKEVLTYKSLIGSIGINGNPSENQNKYMHSKQWCWCPLVNIDMLINYSQYFWLGYDKNVLPCVKFVDKTNVVKNVIGQKNFEYIGQVELYKGEELKQTYETKVKLGDGMRVMFANDDSPEYNNIIYTVSGVGSEISLTEDGSYIPEDTRQDYFVMETGSVDHNEWSLANRWVHRRVLEFMSPDDILDFDKAERPIVCYLKDYQLYNYGNYYRDMVDVAIEGLPSDINGTDISSVQGVTLNDGMKVLFTKMPTTDKRQLFTVSKLPGDINILQPIYNGTNEEDKCATELNDFVHVKFGKYANKNLYFDGENWCISQEKKKVNQEPLFKIYDSDGIYVGSEAQYPQSNFKGGLVFDYYQTDDESAVVDQYLDKKVTSDIYGNYDFINNITTDSYTYVDSYGVTQDIISYMYVKNIKDGTFNNSWLYKSDISYQRVASRILLNSEDIVDGKFSYTIPFKTWSYLQVNLNGHQLDSIDCVQTDLGFTISNAKTGDELIVSMIADDFDILPSEYAFDLPQSFTSNQFNDNISKFNMKDVLSHLCSILQNQKGFEGNVNGTNNSYQIEIDGSLGKYIIQTDNSVLLPMVLENNPSTRILSSISYVAKSYSLMMEKINNRSKYLIKTNKLSELDYDSYLSNLSLLDNIIKDILKQINLGKDKNSPFYNNGVASDIGETFIPATPAYLGMQTPVKPELATRNGVDVIICHDGSFVKAENSVSDLIRLEVENLIYSSILSTFKNNEPTFKAIKNIEGKFRKSDYTKEQFLQLYSHYFTNWTIKKEIDFSKNEKGKLADWKEWNWSVCQDKDGNYLKGSYRAIYNYYFDTVDPSETPWEMLGFVEKPNWFDEIYGEKPYTSNNTLLWKDLEQGYIRGGNNPHYDENYARIGLSEIIPVDTHGNLLSPFECGISTSNPSVQGRKASWKVGDISSIEYDFLKSSDYKFAVESINYILRPIEWTGLNWDTRSTEIKYEGTKYQQTIDTVSKMRPTIKGHLYHNEEVNGVFTRVYGIQQWIVDSLTNENKDIRNLLKYRLDNIEMKLGYCAGAFIEQGSLTIMNDGVELPSDNISIQLIESRTKDLYSYSGVKIIKTEDGYKIDGFDTLHPQFKYLLPIENKNKYSEELNGVVFTSYADYDVSKIKNIPYGSIINSPNEVINFLRGYQAYLENIEGWKFMNLNDEGRQISFNSSIVDFMWFVTNPPKVSENEYPMLMLNPAMYSISLYHFGNIHNVMESINGEMNILDIYQSPLESNEFDVSRSSFNTLISATTKNIFVYRCARTEYEDIILIDCETIFGDVLYNPIFSAIIDNLHVSGIKASQWDGSIFAPGYLNLEEGLIPNFEKNAYDITYAYDVDTFKCQTNYKIYSRNLIGYAKTKCMQELIRNEKSMFDFYKGMIQDKGTIQPIVAMNNSLLLNSSENQSLNLLNEYWAFKAGDYGQITGNNSIEIKLDKNYLKSNPQLITYKLRNGVSNDSYVVNWDDSNWIKKNINNDSVNLAKKYEGDIIVPPVGYVSLEDVDYVVSNPNELENIVESMSDGQTIFMVDNGNSDWDVVKKTGKNRLVSMRYKTLQDAYNHSSEDLVYKITNNGLEYYSSKKENEIKPTDKIYANDNLTIEAGYFKDLEKPTYTGVVEEYVVEEATKCIMGNTVFFIIDNISKINKNSLVYCYADDTYYTYSACQFKVGSATKLPTYNQYRFVIKADTDVDEVTITINGKKFVNPVSKTVTVFVAEGDKVEWDVSAPHCKSISGIKEIKTCGYDLVVSLRYKENEVIFDSTLENVGLNKFDENRLTLGCIGSYEVVVNGAGGGAGGGATFYKGNNAKTYVSSSNNLSNNAIEKMKSLDDKDGTFTYLGSVISNTDESDSRSAGQGGGSGGYIKCSFDLDETNTAIVKVGQGGLGGLSGITIGTTGTSGTSSRFQLLNRTGDIDIDLLAGGGGAGMGALSNQVITGSIDENGRAIKTGAGGIVKRSGTGINKVKFEAFNEGISTPRISGATGGLSLNPDGYVGDSPLYNECGFGGEPSYMESGTNGDNGRLQIKFVSSKEEFIPVIETEDEYKQDFSFDVGTPAYSKVYQKFILNTWSFYQENPKDYTYGLNPDGSQFSYIHGDCVKYQGKLYFCNISHVPTISFEASKWIEYTNYKSDIDLDVIPFYSYDVAETDTLRPDANLFSDSTILYKSRSKEVIGNLKSNIVIHTFNLYETYSENDEVTFEGNHYRCISSTSTNNLIVDGAKYWKVFEGSYANNPEEYDFEKEYTKGNVVIFNNSFFEAIDNVPVGSYPDIHWTIDNQKRLYVKFITDNTTLDNENIVRDYFGLYTDIDCLNPYKAENGVQVVYSDLEDAVLNGDFVLVDSLGTYTELKLNVLEAPNWSDIQVSGSYKLTVNNSIYYASMDEDTMASYEGDDDLDVLHWTESANENDIVVQYNGEKLKYSHISTQTDSYMQPSYQLIDEGNLLYTNVAPGQLTEEDTLYTDSDLTIVAGTYGYFSPKWQKTIVTPNKFEANIKIPDGKQVYTKINGEYSLFNETGIVYMFTNNQYIEFVPQSCSDIITIPNGTELYYDTQGRELVSEELFVFTGIDYVKVNPIQNDVTLHFQSGNEKLYRLLYKSTTGSYENVNKNIYVKKPDNTFDTFEQVFFENYYKGYSEVIYNDGVRTGYIDLYRKDFGTYTKITDKLYFKLKNFNTYYYYDSDVQSSKVTSVETSGSEKVIVGLNGYYNPQCKGMHTPLNHVLTTRDELEQINLYRNEKDDIVYILSERVKREISHIEPTDPKYLEEARRITHLFVQIEEEKGNYCNEEDVVGIIMNWIADGEIISRTAKVYHYYYTNNNERYYMKLFKYGNQFYIQKDIDENNWMHVSINIGTESDLITFYKVESEDIEEDDILNVLSYKNDGDLLYIDRDCYYSANFKENKNVIADIFSLSDRMSAKTKADDECWLKAEVLNQDYAFNLANIEDNQPDNTTISSVYLVNDKTDETLVKCHVIDPIQGLFIDSIDKEINYISSYDPICDYTNGQNINKVNVGDLWWDISKVKYLNYKQSHSRYWWYERNYLLTDNEFKASNWIKQLPGSEIVINEWTSSKEKPEGISNYVTKIELDEQTRLLKAVYYYWKKNPTLLPERVTREYPASYIADKLNTKVEDGVNIVSYVDTTEDTSSLLITNYTSYTSGFEAVLQVNTDINEFSDAHSDWDIIRSNSTDEIPNKLWNQLIDSLVGYKEVNNGEKIYLPDENLSDSLKYGISIRPRQSMIKDTYEAKRNLVQIMNNITLSREMDNATDVDSWLVNFVDEPKDYNIEVQQYMELKNITDEKLVGSRILVKFDENYGNIWTIYRMYPNNQFKLEEWKEYDINNFIKYSDLYKSDIIKKTGIIAIVENVEEMIELDANVGDLVKVVQDRWYIYQKTSSSWELVAKEKSLIEFTDGLYSYEDYKNEVGTYINLNNSNYWLSETVYNEKEIVKVKQEDGSFKFYRCIEQHLSGEIFDDAEKNKWVEIYNQTMYDYKKNEADICLKSIMNYFSEGKVND